MKIYEELIKANKKSAVVDIILNGNNYLMIPRGRSEDDKWYGFKYLDYIVTGNKKELNDLVFIDKLLISMDISINYVARNISVNEKINTIVSDFILKNEGVNRISVNLDSKRENEIIIFKFSQNKNGDFSANSKDAVIIKDNCSKKDFLLAIGNQLEIKNTSR